MSVHAVHGTVTIDTSGTRELLLPAESLFPIETGTAPVPWLCRISPSDPADLGLFKLDSIGQLTAPHYTAVGFLGGRAVNFAYTLTGGSPIDVDFYLVWDTDIDVDAALSYNGDLP
jgi:hypothetical protein